MKIEEMKYCPEMPKKARPIVIIGSGGIVTGSHLPAYKMAGYPVLGIYNRTFEHAKKAADEFGIPHVAKTIAELVDIAKKEGAVFDVTTPANVFYDILKQLPDGAGVLIQKPMGESIEQAKAILNLCRTKKLTAGINFQLRQSPYMIAARKLIAEGLIGEIVDIEWRLVSVQPWNLWTFLFEKERMEINYHSIHYIDCIRSFVGNPIGVYAKTMQHPKMTELAQTRTAIIMDYGDRLRVNLHINHNHDYATKHQESMVKIEGLKGAIRIRLGLLLDYPKGKPDEVEYITYDSKEWKTLEVKGSWFNEAFIGTMGGLMKKLDDPSYSYMNDIEDAYHTMCVVEACYESNGKGVVPIDYSCP